MNIKILILNIFLRKIRNVNIILRKIDDYYYINPLIDGANTNKKGFSKIDLLEGVYLIKIFKKKYYEEKIIKVRKNKKQIIIWAPFLFEFSYREKIVDQDIIRKFYEIYRTDKKRCFKCNKQYKGLLDIFLCHFCKKYFCSKHRLPENHECLGEPRSPPGGYMETWSRKGKTIRGHP